MAKKQFITEALNDFCARIELEAQPMTVCRVTHPDAVDGGAFEGTYAGFPLVNGKTAEALLSDGSFVPPRAGNAAEPELVPVLTEVVAPLTADPVAPAGAE
jgi:hypothetical protein